MAAATNIFQFLLVLCAGWLQRQQAAVIAYEAMNTSPCVVCASSYNGHRFPVEIISHCVWLYFRFCLSFRDVEGHRQWLINLREFK
jgi:hypothetical protein